MLIKDVVFRYRILELDLTPDRPLLNFPSLSNKSSKWLPKGYDRLPNNTAVTSWSDNIIIHDNHLYADKDLYTFRVKILQNENFVDVIAGNNTLISFIDSTTDNSYTF